MHYIIDGYNVLFRALQAMENLQLQREALIYDFSQKALLLNLEMTLVFDSYYQESEGTRSHLKNLEIIYTDQGETADDYIINMLKKTNNPKQFIVVTSDQKLAWRARRLLSKTETTEAFMASLNQRYKKKLHKPDLPHKDSKPTPPPAPKAAPKPPVPHTANALPANECFDFYLQTFEKELLEEESKRQKPNPAEPPISPSGPGKPKKIKPRKEPTLEKKEPDFDRWLRIFESSRNNDQDS